MAEETTKTAPEAVVEKETTAVVDKVEKPEAEEKAEKGKDEEPQGEGEGEGEGEKKVEEESAPVKEESNKVEDLVDPEKKALDEFKELIREALNKHEFTAPPAPAKVVEEPKPEAEEKKKEDEAAAKQEEKEKEAEKEEPKPEETKEGDQPKTEEKKETETVEVEVEEKAIPAAAESSETTAEKAKEKAEPVEEVKETIVHQVQPPSEATVEVEVEVKEETPPSSPEEVSIWGVPLLADERSDVILLKFLRARDFKVKDAFAMLKNVVAWRKQFKIDELLEEEGIIEGLEKVVYIHGVDKEGHPVSYNALGEFQDRELYSRAFADAEKRGKFLRWYIQFLERNIRKLDFTPDGVCTIVQVVDLKDSPGLILFKKDFRQATNQAFQLLQDNYPEFVAKEVFINVPWWYVAYNRMISPFLTQRTKSKFVFAGPTKTTEALFKYIAPEHVPVRYGGLSKEGDQEFTPADSATLQVIKPTSKHIIELPITEACTLVWEVRVIGWDITYGAEFIPSAEGAYTLVVQKSRKIGPADEQVISCSFPVGETGKVVLTFDNQTTKKKQLLSRSKTKLSGPK
ncbi:patellin-3-like [Andrographis paniculata]|uniref:patellin-3-like n=1 Tax=Andrographis paniculata TaxID=175694 RepID=UPI0021E74190|nr:patellin-3-like [Andrographis paniculata]